MNAELFAFVLYFVMLVGVGLFFFFKGRKRANEKEYFLGGRSMGPWVTAMSAQASDMSAWLLMGLPGSILAFGFGQMWIGIGLALGTAANWIFSAKRLRKFSKAAGDAITVPQYLSNRFMAKSHTLQIICAIIFFVCFTVYVASGFVAGASVFTTIFPSLSTRTAMLVFALAMFICTFFGGFKAVCWTDFFQGLLMVAALLAVPMIIVATQNLDTSALDTVYSYTDAVSGQKVECSFGAGVFSASWKEILSGLAWGLGYFGMPHIIVRFMSIEKPSMVKRYSGNHLGCPVPWRNLFNRLFWKNAHRRAVAHDRFSEHGIHHLCQNALPGIFSRHPAGGHHGGFHVHGRFSAAGGVQLLYFGYLQAPSAKKRRGKRDSLGWTAGSAAGSGHRVLYCFQQRRRGAGYHEFSGKRLGRLWLFLWAGGTAVSVLEKVYL